jgi:hypothetical protein
MTPALCAPSPASPPSPAVRALRLLATAFAVLGVLYGWTPPAAAAARSATITRSAHLSFENCNTQHITLSVTVPRHAFTPDEPVTFAVRLRNTGGTNCGAPPAQLVPRAGRSLTVGPCGILPVVVRNARGVNVYPSPVSPSCPADLGLRLGPHRSASTTGSWDQTEYLGRPATTQQAPPGTYRLVVGGAVTVPVTLAPG